MKILFYDKEDGPAIRVFYDKGDIVFDWDKWTVHQMDGKKIIESFRVKKWTHTHEDMTKYGPDVKEYVEKFYVERIR